MGPLGAVVALLSLVERWPADDRHELVQIIRAKGGRSELEYLRRFDGHRRLRSALQALSA